jgi:hypothetical protein
MSNGLILYNKESAVPMGFRINAMTAGRSIPKIPVQTATQSCDQMDVIYVQVEPALRTCIVILPTKQTVHDVQKWVRGGTGITGVRTGTLDPKTLHRIKKPDPNTNQDLVVVAAAAASDTTKPSLRNNNATAITTQQLLKQVLPTRSKSSAEPNRTTTQRVKADNTNKDLVGSDTKPSLRNNATVMTQKLKQQVLPTLHNATATTIQHPKGRVKRTVGEKQSVEQQPNNSTTIMPQK